MSIGSPVASTINDTAPSASFPIGNNIETINDQRQFWQNIVHVLSGPHAGADAIQHAIQQAEDAASLLLQSGGNHSPPSNAYDTSSSSPSFGLPASTEQVGHPSRVHRLLRDHATWAAMYALGSAGAACCAHLSMRAEWACAWLGIQQKLLRVLHAVSSAVDASAPTGAEVSELIPPLLPLWSTVKGVAGMRSTSPEIRIAAVQLLQEALLAQNAAAAAVTDSLARVDAANVSASTRAENGVEPTVGVAAVAATAPVATVLHAGAAVTNEDAPSVTRGTAASNSGVGSGSGSGAVSTWNVCRELACELAPKDNDPQVVATALRAATALFALCRDQCRAREWRLLAEGVLTAAGRTRNGEVWSAAEAFVRRHSAHSGWRTALRHITSALMSAAADPDGPLLGAAFTVSLCRAAAAACALEASLGAAAPSSPVIERSLPTSSGHNSVLGVDTCIGSGDEHGVLDFLVALAACVSDAARHGGWVSEAEPVPDVPLHSGPSGSARGSAPPMPHHRAMRWVVFGGSMAAAWTGACGGAGDGGLMMWPSATQAAATAAAFVPAAAAAVAPTPADGSETEEDGVVPDQARALAASAQAACCSLGCLLGPASCLDALEALLRRAESAPLALSPPTGSASGSDDSEQQQQQQQQQRLYTSPGGRAAVSRAGLLTAAAAVALGARGKLDGSWRGGTANDAVGAAAGAAAAAQGGGGQGADKSMASPLPSAVPAGAARVAAVVPTRPSPDTKDATSELAVAVRVVRLMRRVVALIQEPEKLLFSEVGGAPAMPTEPAVVAAARQHNMATVAGLHVLQTLLATLPTPLTVMSVAARCSDDSNGGGSGPVKSLGSARTVHPDTGKGEGGGGGGGQEEVSFGNGAARSNVEDGRRRLQVVIEELPESCSSPCMSPGQLMAMEWQQQQQELVPELVLLCATYAPARPAATCSEEKVPAGVAADPGPPLPPADIFTPWAGGGAPAAADSLLEALHRRAKAQPPPSRTFRSSAAASAGAASLSLMLADVVSEQDTIAVCLPGLLKERIRPIVVQRHVQSLEEGPIRPYTGPDTFIRALAARRLAWLLMRSRHPFVGEALKTALPALLACCDDPTPGVAQHGVAALHAATVECLAADLQWQRELLLDQARHMVVGCQEQLWPLACFAAVALVRRIEGKDPRAVGYHRLASELLTEIERQAHLPARRLPFIPAFANLLSALGLTALRYTSRLMPIILEWLHAYDLPTRVSALKLLAVVVRMTWPRVAAHARVLWRHMLVVLLRASPGLADGDAEIDGDLVGNAGTALAALSPSSAAAAAVPTATKRTGSGGIGCRKEKGRGVRPDEQLPERCHGDGDGLAVGGQQGSLHRRPGSRGKEEVPGDLLVDMKREVNGEEETVEALVVCELLIGCAWEQVRGFQPTEAAFPAGAERLHKWLLRQLQHSRGDSGPAA